MIEVHGAALTHTGGKTPSHCRGPPAAPGIVLALPFSEANRRPRSTCGLVTEVGRCLLTSPPTPTCPPFILQPWSRTPCTPERWWISLRSIDLSMPSPQDLRLLGCEWNSPVVKQRASERLNQFSATSVKSNRRSPRRDAGPHHQPYLHCLLHCQVTFHVKVPTC